MNCKKCGAENVDGAKFCCKCGSPLDTPEKNTKINFSDINVEKILSNDKIPKQVKDIINKIMQLPRKVLIGAVAGIVVLIVLIGAVRSHGRTIDLNKYLTIIPAVIMDMDQSRQRLTGILLRKSMTLKFHTKRKTS